MRRGRAKYQWAWLERPRGHSKTADLAVMASWALFASRRQLFGVAAAGDQDLARLLRDAVRRLVDCNPWLRTILDVQANRIVNSRTGSTATDYLIQCTDQLRFDARLRRGR